jgi:hypothetical protein
MLKEDNKKNSCCPLDAKGDAVVLQHDVLHKTMRCPLVKRKMQQRKVLSCLLSSKQSKTVVKTNNRCFVLPTDHETYSNNSPPKLNNAFGVGRLTKCDPSHSGAPQSPSRRDVPDHSFGR